MVLDSLSKHGWLFVWLALLVTAYLVRDIYPLDETRYLGVAWEMWAHNNFLIPTLNGEPYSHKPPMLFWLFHLGWFVFGVNEWWPRLVPPLFALAGLFMVRILARNLWPQRQDIARLAPWILGGCLFWSIYTTVTMFEMLLMVMVLIAVIGLWRVVHGYPLQGWLLVGVACGFGLLIKGPVMIAHIFFPVILAPWWSEQVRQDKRRWYGGFVAAMLLASAIALSWVIPAINAAGPMYEQEILWHQSVDRAVSSFAHARPFWWYVPLLPFLLFPWLLWPPVWRALVGLQIVKDNSVKFLLSWLVPTFIMFSLISGKQVYYLVPMFPAVTLLVSRAMDQWQAGIKKTNNILPASFIALIGILLLVLPKFAFEWLPILTESFSLIWGASILFLAAILIVSHRSSVEFSVIQLSLITNGLTILLMWGIFSIATPLQNVKPAALLISQWQNEGYPVAHIGKYHNQFQFAGRLQKELDIIEKGELITWCHDHPDGYVIMYYTKAPSADELQPAFIQPYRNKWLTIWAASALTNAN